MKLTKEEYEKALDDIKVDNISYCIDFCSNKGGAIEIGYGMILAKNGFKLVLTRTKMVFHVSNIMAWIYLMMSGMKNIQYLKKVDFTERW